MSNGFADTNEKQSGFSIVEEDVEGLSSEERAENAEVFAEPWAWLQLKYASKFDCDIF